MIPASLNGFKVGGPSTNDGHELKVKLLVSSVADHDTLETRINDWLAQNHGVTILEIRSHLPTFGGKQDWTTTIHTQGQDDKKWPYMPYVIEIWYTR